MALMIFRAVNQSRFPVLGTAYTFFLPVLVGSLRYFRLLWLVRWYNMPSLGYTALIFSCIHFVFIFSCQEQGQVTPGEQVVLENVRRTKKILQITTLAKAKVKSIQKSHHVIESNHLDLTRNSQTHENNFKGCSFPQSVFNIALVFVEC